MTLFCLVAFPCWEQRQGLELAPEQHLGVPGHQSSPTEGGGLCPCEADSWGAMGGLTGGSKLGNTSLITGARATSPPRDKHAATALWAVRGVTFQPWISSHFILTTCTHVNRPGYNHIKLYY